MDNDKRGSTTILWFLVYRVGNHLWGTNNSYISTLPTLRTVSFSNCNHVILLDLFVMFFVVSRVNNYVAFQILYMPCTIALYMERRQSCYRVRFFKCNNLNIISISDNDVACNCGHNCSSFQFDLLWIHSHRGFSLLFSPLVYMDGRMHWTR